MTLPTTCLDLAAEIIALGAAQKLTLATAESCTGGLISACLTDIPGSSAVLDRGFVAYSNQAKQDMLGVPASLIEGVGAVSEEVAIAMAEGARTRARVDLAVAVTGVAGPGGGTATKPVGLVHMALSIAGKTDHVSTVHPGNRQAVRQATVEAALTRIKAYITA